MKMLIRIFILSALFISCIRQFNDFGVYQDFLHTIIIDSNHTFYSKKESLYFRTVDTCSGTWIQKDGYLILNSYRQPINEKYFIVLEKYCDTIKTGTKVIQVKTGSFIWQEAEKDSIMVFFNDKIEVNNQMFKIPNNGKVILGLKTVNTIRYNWRFTDYPIYHIKNKNANYFFIELLIPEKKNDFFPIDSYYSKAKFKIKNDTLIYGKCKLKRLHN